jgi:hypothetical protein
MLPADYILLAAIIFVIGCSLYFKPRIGSDKVAMQWGLDGKPTWYAPTWIALWATAPFMIAIRIFIWAAMVYAPQTVHGADIGIAGFAIIMAGCHLFILKMAERSR